MLQRVPPSHPILVLLMDATWQGTPTGEGTTTHTQVVPACNAKTVRTCSQTDCIHHIGTQRQSRRSRHVTNNLRRMTTATAPAATAASGSETNPTTTHPFVLGTMRPPKNLNKHRCRPRRHKPRPPPTRTQASACRSDCPVPATARLVLHWPPSDCATLHHCQGPTG